MDSIGPNPIQVGLLAGEPMRLEGLTTVFEQEPQPGRARLLPVMGSLGELLADAAIDYLVIDLSSPSGRLETLAEVRSARPQLRLIVIGPEGNDELVLDSITAGARAYLAGSAGPDVVRQAIEVVISGSIWAPRRLLSQLIDRMLLSSRNNGAGSPSEPYGPRAGGARPDTPGALQSRDRPRTWDRGAHGEGPCEQINAQDRGGKPG